MAILLFLASSILNGSRLSKELGNGNLLICTAKEKQIRPIQHRNKQLRAA
ncbi:hypothetical protein CCACVL1_02834 [Corchorus capsularis]|uniref:Uncharacterized protein n=1 Tax=Corchorus capsularis TaxID=210143 RepID=A0A1R3K5D8_COCAP|nr:hypothetical protein CCACVL1_02834 [Corchorus capsularis]